MSFPFGKSPLRRAIERGLTDGELDKELKELGKVVLKSRSDAEDVCWGMQRLNADAKDLGKKTYTLAVLFQHVNGRSSAAFDALQVQGIPELLRLYDEINSAPGDDNTSTLLFILKIFGFYGTVAGTLKIVEAARQPLKPDGYLWNVIFRGFTAGHPEKELLFNSLREPLPEGFIAVSLLDAA